jgi:8-amino-7-oxononanoate synthase
MFEPELSYLEQQHLLRKLRIIESYHGPWIVVEGKKVLLMCSNDYLGLANHPALCEAACEAMKFYGFGSGASRLVSGSSAVHHELEFRLARFKNTDAALVFNSGYAANTGIIPAVTDAGDVILSDCMNHASIVDGCRLSKAETHVYPHCDVNHIEDILKNAKNAKRKLIVTDGVFSMDGDIAPLPDIVLLSEKHGAMLMVDDAHATGVLGRTGRGTVEHFGLEGRVQIQMGTLGKALGSFGAYAAGDKDIIEFVMNRSRSFIYSTALPPSVCAASIAALNVVEQEPDLRQKLWDNQNRLISGLKTLGISVGNSETPIIPIMIGGSAKALATAEKLFDSGIYAASIRPPTVPEGTARIRMTLMATHSHDDIDMALDIIKKLKQEGLL